MKFGVQQQIWNSITARWPNMKIFKIQNGSGRHFNYIFGDNLAGDCLISVTFYTWNLMAVEYHGDRAIEP